MVKHPISARFLIALIILMMLNVIPLVFQRLTRWFGIIEDISGFAPTIQVVRFWSLVSGLLFFLFAACEAIHLLVLWGWR